MECVLSDDKKVTVFQWAKFGAGAVFLALLLYVHVYHKELPFWLLGLPFILLGVDPAAFIKNIGGKK